MPKDVLITPGDALIQFSSSAGTGSGQILADDNNNLVISNLVGDVLLGDGASDVFIGDGTNNVDIVFEQNGEIRDDTSGKSITLGSSTTNIFISGSNTIAMQKQGGNVGIGKTTATKTLEVAGDISASGDLHLTDITASGEIKADHFLATDQDDGYHFGDSSVALQRANNALEVKYSSTVAQFSNTLGLNLTGHITASGNISSSATGSFGKMTIGTSTMVHGNTQLTVAGGHGGHDFARFTRTDSGTSFVGINANSLDPQIRFYEGSDYAAIGVDATNSNLVFATGSKVNGKEAMVVDTDGKVGIGTTNPSNLFEVSSTTTAISVFKSANDAPIRVESTDGTTGITFKDNSAEQQIYYRGAKNAFYIESPTKLGLGTNDPTETLDVRGSASFSGHITASGNISASGNITASSYTGSFVGDGSGLTGVTSTATVDIDGFDAFSGVPHATDDEFLISDDGTEKRATMTMVANGGFALVSGDATIAAGGALTIGDNKIGNDELKQDDDITLQSLTTTNNISGSTIEGQTLTADVFLSSPSASLTNITTTNITASGNISSSGTGIFNKLEIHGADGTLSADYILHQGDDNTKFGFPSNDHFKIRTAGTDRYVVDTVHQFTGAITADNHITLENNKEIKQKDSGGTGRTIIELDSSNDLNIGGSYAGSLKIIGGGSYAEVARFDDDGHFVQVSGKNITTNHITASGNISSSGDVIANEFKVDGETVLNINSNELRVGSDSDLAGIQIGRSNAATKNIQLYGTVTASGDISASGTITATSFTNINTTNITASNNISASGNVYADKVFLENNDVIRYSSANSGLYVAGGIQTINNSTFGNTDDDTHTFNGGIIAGNITASGHISGSLTSTLTLGGDIIANDLIVNQITASGHISSSGNVIGNLYQPTFHNFVMTADTENYIPFPTSATEATSTSYLREWVAPFDGSLSKIRFRGSTGARNTTFKLYVNAVIAGGATATSDTVNAGVADTTYTFTFDETAAVYSAGDLIRVTIDPLIAPQNVNLTMIWNYNTNSL